MRLLHTADIHLGAPMTSIADSTKAKERKMEVLETFERMLAYARDNLVDSVLIAGDLFDSDRVPGRLIDRVLGLIGEAKEMNFFYIEGNHEGKGVLSGRDHLPENLYLFGKKWASYALDGKERIVLSGASLPENTEGFFENLHIDENQVNIVMLHGQVPEEIPLRRLVGKGIDYLALGHVHSYREAALDSRGSYVYCGCLEPRGFDEAGDHGFVLIDIDEKALSVSSRFKSFAKRRIHSVEVDISGRQTAGSILSRIMGQLSTEGIHNPEDILDLTLVGEVDYEAQKDLVYFERSLARDFYYVRVKDRTSLYVDYRDFAHDISLKGEFVRKVEAEEDLSEEEKARIIRYGIRALAGEEILD